MGLMYKCDESFDIVEFIELDIKHGMFAEGSDFPFVRVTYDDGGFTRRYDNLYEEDMDLIVQDLFKFSLGKRIDAIEKYVHGENVEAIRGYELYIEDSKDGSTNITPEVVEEFRRLLSMEWGAV